MVKMKYILKKVLIGVLLFLIIGFLKSQNVFAFDFDSGALKIGTRSCVNSNGSLMCSDNVRYSTFVFKNNVQPVNFNLSSNVLMTDFIFDYSGKNYTNNTGSDLYFGINSFRVPINPTSSSCQNLVTNLNNMLVMKNALPIACSYEDSIGNKYDCLGDILISKNILTISGWGSPPVLLPTISNPPFILKIPNGSSVYNLAIKLGSYAVYNGNIDNIYTGSDNINISPYYLDYPILNSCTYSRTEVLPFTYSLYNDYFKFTNKNYNLNLFQQLNVSELNDNIQYYTDNQQTLKDLALQDSLIGFDSDTQSTDITIMTEDLESTLSVKMTGNITIFNDFLALPINLLNENAVHDLTFGDNAGVHTDCLEYDSSFLTGDNIHVGAQPINVKLPFVSNHLRLTCSDLDILSPYNKVGGSFYAGSSVNGWGSNFTGLDKTIGPIYHILIDGVLSYWFIISLFRFCKEVLDPEDNSLEVLDL